MYTLNFNTFYFRYEPPINSTGLFQYNTAAPTRNLCTALLFPTIATIVGNVLFSKSSYSDTKKALMVKIYKYFLFLYFILNCTFIFQGGLIYITVKGVIKFYQHHNNEISRRSLRVINHPYSNIGGNH